MKIGVWLHDYFYRKHCGTPMYGLQEKGWFFLNMDEVCRVTPDIFGELEKLGVECVDMAGSLARLEKMAPVLQKRGDIGMVLHTEGDPALNRCNSTNKHTRRAAVENLKRNIDIASEIAVNTITIHPPSCCDSAIAAVKNCCRYAGERNVVLAIENSGYGEKGASDVIKFVAAMDIEGMEYTFDAGHANIGGSALNCAEMMGSKIAHIHWHDNDGKSDQHLAPGMGNIDFVPLMNLLHKIDGRRKKEITLTLECDKPSVDYEEAFIKTKELRDSVLSGNE